MYIVLAETGMTDGSKHLGETGMTDGSKHHSEHLELRDDQRGVRSLDAGRDIRGHYE
jgi:hypothetical protein